MKSVLPTLSNIIKNQPEAPVEDNKSGGTSKKGKKRVRAYEGNELLNASREVICATLSDNRVLVESLEVAHILLRGSFLSPVVHSIASRIVLALVIILPQITPSVLSSDVSLHKKVLLTVRSVAVTVGLGTPSGSGKSLGLAISTLDFSPGNIADAYQIDLALHPRVPPLLRSLPQVEALALFPAEESTEEQALREQLGLGAVQVSKEAQDAVMEVEIEHQLDPVPIIPNHIPTKRVETPKVDSPSIPAPLRAQPPTPLVSPAPETRPPTVELEPTGVLATAGAMVLPQEEEDDDEEMPSIDMGSDSEED